MTETAINRIKQSISEMYAHNGGPISQAVISRLERFKQTTTLRKTAQELFNQHDIILITYGDILRNRDTPPLKNLRNFYQSHLWPTINTIHILPFYPYSSDDGFSVIDYLSVDPALGSWNDINELEQPGSQLMFDAVINHISSQSTWFSKFLARDEKYKDYFLTVDPDVDLSLVTRPRSLPLLTPFETADGLKYVWTTFSADQVDLNFANPDTLLDILDVILFYIEQGASLIRLDAIAYLWKEIGTTCIHLPQTHAFVKLLRAIVDEVSPGVLLITETNVPHEENVSYFGDGSDEAHLVYQFSLPPLIAHAIIRGSSRYLNKWASSLEFPSEHTSFFNFTASHDGIGVRPVTGILPDKELTILLERTRAHGGKISSKTNQDGSTSPYELNINYYDLLNNPDSKEPQMLKVDRFMASQAIMLMLKGIPGIYFHSLVGSRNFYQGVEETGHARAINREKLILEPFLHELQDPETLRYRVFHKYKTLLELRTKEKAFHPAGKQEILDLGNSVFAVSRTALDGSEQILAIQNVTSQQVDIDISMSGLKVRNDTVLQDLISLEKYSSQNGVVTVKLVPYQTLWLEEMQSGENRS